MVATNLLQLQLGSLLNRQTAPFVVCFRPHAPIVLFGQHAQPMSTTLCLVCLFLQGVGHPGVHARLQGRPRESCPINVSLDAFAQAISLNDVGPFPRYSARHYCPPPPPCPPTTATTPHFLQEKFYKYLTLACDFVHYCNDKQSEELDLLPLVRTCVTTVAYYFWQTIHLLLQHGEARAAGAKQDQSPATARTSRGPPPIHVLGAPGLFDKEQGRQHSLGG